MLALHGVMRLVKSCHINIAHHSVECIGLQWHMRKMGLVRYPPNISSATIPLVRKSR